MSPSSSFFSPSSSSEEIPPLRSADLVFKAAEEFWDGLRSGEPLSVLVAALQKAFHASSSSLCSSSTSSARSSEAPLAASSASSSLCAVEMSSAPLGIKEEEQRTLPFTHKIPFLTQVALLLSVEDQVANEEATSLFLSSPEIRRLMREHWKRSPNPSPGRTLHETGQDKQNMSAEGEAYSRERKRRVEHPMEPLLSSSSPPFVSSPAIPFGFPESTLKKICPTGVEEETRPTPTTRRTGTGSLKETEGKEQHETKTSSSAASLLAVVAPRSFVSSTTFAFPYLSFLLHPTVVSQMVREEWKKAHLSHPSSFSSLSPSGVPFRTPGSRGDTSSNTPFHPALWVEALQWLQEAPLTPVTATARIAISRRLGKWQVALESLMAIPAQEWTEGDVAGTVQALYVAGRAHWEANEASLGKKEKHLARRNHTKGKEHLGGGGGVELGKASVVEANCSVEGGPLTHHPKQDQEKRTAPPLASPKNMGEVENLQHHEEEEVATVEGGGNKEEVCDASVGEVSRLCRLRPSLTIYSSSEEERANQMSFPFPSRSLATSSTETSSASESFPSSAVATHLRFLCHTAARVLCVGSHVIPTWRSPAVLHHFLRLYAYVPSLWAEACHVVEQGLALPRWPSSVRDATEEKDSRSSVLPTVAVFSTFPSSSILHEDVAPLQKEKKKKVKAEEENSVSVCQTKVHQTEEETERSKKRMEGAPDADQLSRSSASLYSDEVDHKDSGDEIVSFPSAFSSFSSSYGTRCLPLRGMQPNTLTLYRILEVLRPHKEQQWERGLAYASQLMQPPYDVQVGQDVATVELLLQLCIQGRRREDALHYMSLCNASRHENSLSMASSTSVADFGDGVHASSVGVPLKKSKRKQMMQSNQKPHRFAEVIDMNRSIVRDLRFPLQESLARLLCEWSPEREMGKKEDVDEHHATKATTRSPHTSPVSHLLSAADVYTRSRRQDSNLPLSPSPTTPSYLSAEELSMHFNRHTLSRAYNGLLQQSKTLEEAERYKKSLFSLRAGIENESLAHLIPLHAQRGKWEAALHGLQELVHHPRRQARFLPTAALHDSVQYALEQAPAPGPSWEVSVKLFKDMIEKAQVPLSEVAFQSVVKKCFSQGASGPAQKLFEYLIRHGVK